MCRGDPKVPFRLRNGKELEVCSYLFPPAGGSVMFGLCPGQRELISGVLSGIIPESQMRLSWKGPRKLLECSSAVPGPAWDLVVGSPTPGSFPDVWESIPRVPSCLAPWAVDAFPPRQRHLGISIYYSFVCVSASDLCRSFSSQWWQSRPSRSNSFPPPPPLPSWAALGIVGLYGSEGEWRQSRNSSWLIPGSFWCSLGSQEPSLSCGIPDFQPLKVLGVAG